MRDALSVEFRVLADGSATDEGWGAGALVTGLALARVAGDGLAHLDYACGGPQRFLLPELRGPVFAKQESNAVARR